MPPEDKEIQSLKNDKIKAISRKNWKEVAEICNFLGNKLAERGRLEEALEQHEEELEISSQRLKDVKAVMLSHRCLGQVYADMQEYNKSLKHLKTYLESAEKTKDIVEMQRSWATLGRTYFMKQDLLNAESAFRMSLKLADRLVCPKKLSLT